MKQVIHDAPFARSVENDCLVPIDAVVVSHPQLVRRSVSIDGDTNVVAQLLASRFPRRPRVVSNRHLATRQQREEEIGLVEMIRFDALWHSVDQHAKEHPPDTVVVECGDTIHAVVERSRPQFSVPEVQTACSSRFVAPTLPLQEMAVASVVDGVDEVAFLVVFQDQARVVHLNYASVASSSTTKRPIAVAHTCRNRSSLETSQPVGAAHGRVLIPLHIVNALATIPLLARLVSTRVGHVDDTYSLRQVDQVGASLLGGAYQVSIYGNATDDNSSHRLVVEGSRRVDEKVLGVKGCEVTHHCVAHVGSVVAADRLEHALVFWNGVREVSHVCPEVVRASSDEKSLCLHLRICLQVSQYTQ